ncbi:MAG: tetraacyldisaccharide 4'-kinase [Cellvibrionaceae bacterium]
MNPASKSLSQRLRENILHQWYGKPSWLYFLLPLELFFRWVGFRRRQQKNVSSRSIKTPLIVVGNISVGGTGKSPLIGGITQYFQERGERVALISRGYRLDGCTIDTPVKLTDSHCPSEVGDEPVMLKRRLKAPVVVCKNRLAAAKTAEEAYAPSVILSDDGMQHYQLPRDIEIAVIDERRKFGNGHCLPVGPLREPVTRLQSVDAIVLNGAEDHIENSEKIFLQILKETFDVPVFDMHLLASKIVNLVTGEVQSLADWKGESVTAIAGIGNPERFFHTLEEKALSVKGIKFPDHHNYQLDDLVFEGAAPVVMTEKDVVKCRELAAQLPHNNYWYVPVETEIEPAFWPWLEQQVQKVQQVQQAAAVKS